MTASLDILCCNHVNLKNIITKIEHKKTFCGPSKNLKNTSWPINICLKYFMAPTKTLPLSPSYILKVQSLNKIHKKKATFLCHFLYLKYDIRYFSFEKAVYICHDYLVCNFFTLKHFEDFFAQMSPRLSVFWNASLKQTLHFPR